MDTILLKIHLVWIWEKDFCLKTCRYIRLWNDIMLGKNADAFLINWYKYFIENCTVSLAVVFLFQIMLDHFKKCLKNYQYSFWIKQNQWRTTSFAFFFKLKKTKNMPQLRMCLTFAHETNTLLGNDRETYIQQNL